MDGIQLSQGYSHFEEGVLLFITQFPEIPGTHFIDLGRMKGWVDLGATQWLRMVKDRKTIFKRIPIFLKFLVT